ncbi:MAG: HAMP domain-containing protein [Anaerolineae bacterium]|nr:HAMP domain-containing protein [Anaerolineae bacterium]
MNIKHISINRLLQLCLGMILVFVVVLGVVSWSFTHRLWVNTADIYDHPLTVQRNINNLESEILRMHRSMLDIYLAESEEEVDLYLSDIALHESHALEQLAVVEERYLGPQEDVTRLRDLIIAWRPIRETNIDQARGGRLSEAINCSQPGGVCGQHVDKILAAQEVISQYASNKGDTFYQEAKEQYDGMVLGLWMLLGMILLLTIVITVLLVRTINTPLNQLVQAAQAFARGNLGARSQYSLRNEFGRVSAAFNALADTVQADLHNRQAQQEIAEGMLAESDLGAFCSNLLQSLMAPHRFAMRRGVPAEYRRHRL